MDFHSFRTAAGLGHWGEVWLPKPGVVDLADWPELNMR